MALDIIWEMYHVHMILLFIHVNFIIYVVFLHIIDISIYNHYES